jgi:hypothetical protein
LAEHTVLVVGGDDLADALEGALEARGADVERAPTDGALDLILVAAPDLVVLSPDAAQSDAERIRDGIVRAHAAEPSRLLVLCPRREAARVGTHRHGWIGTLEPDLGADELAETICQLVGLLAQPGSRKRSLRGLLSSLRRNTAPVKTAAVPEPPAPTDAPVLKPASRAVGEAGPAPKPAATVPAVTPDAASGLKSAPKPAAAAAKSRSATAVGLVAPPPPAAGAEAPAAPVAPPPAAAKTTAVGIGAPPTAPAPSGGGLDAESLFSEPPTVESPAPLQMELEPERAEAPAPRPGVTPAPLQMELEPERAEAPAPRSDETAAPPDTQLEPERPESPAANAAPETSSDAALAVDPAVTATAPTAEAAEDFFELSLSEPPDAGGAASAAGPEVAPDAAPLEAAGAVVSDETPAQAPAAAAADPLGLIAGAPAVAASIAGDPVARGAALLSRLPVALRWGTPAALLVIGIATATLAAPGDGTHALPALEVVGSMQHVAAPVAAAPDGAGSEEPEPAAVEASEAVQPEESEVEEVAEAALEPAELDDGEEEGLDDEGVETTGDRRLDVGRARANRLVNVGHRLRRGGRLGMAEASYLKALDAEPRYARAMAGLVRVHLKRRDGVEALRWARKLTQLQPRRSNNQLLLGDAYALMDAHGAARKAWTTAARYGSRAARKRLANAR